MIYQPPEKITRTDLRKLNIAAFEMNPLGRGFTPEETETINDNSLKFTYAQVNSFNQILHPEVRIITGRRGSGKSALISVIKSQTHYDYCIDCNPSELRKWVEDSLQFLSESSATADDYANECRNFFWILIFRRLIKDHSARAPKIKAFLNSINVCPRGAVHEAVQKWVESNAGTKSPTLSVTSGLLTWLLNTKRTEFKEARKEASRILLNKQVVVLIDNPEDFRLCEFSDGIRKRSTRATRLFRALAYAAAVFQPRDCKICIKYFIPTEIYRFLSRGSINWGKVRGSIHALRWSPDELLCMIAKRIRFFKFQTGILKSNQVNLSELDVVENAREEWESVISPYLINKVTGTKENSWVYVLRHTQLMPRQVILAANSILANALKNKNSFPATERCIIKGIDDSETDNAKASLGLFEQVHGEHLLEFCEESFEDMSCRMSAKDLEKKVYKPNKVELEKLFNITTFKKFRRLLLEIGVIGRQRPTNDNDSYYCALFETEVDDILRVERQDYLYVHPMFIKHLSIDRKNQVLDKPVCSNGLLKYYKKEL